MISAKLIPLGKDFFDKKKVMDAMSNGQRKVLSKFGAFVRTRSRTSIRPAKVMNRKEVREAKKRGVKKTPRKIYVASKPGEPPRSRRGDVRKLISAAWDASEKDVFIGPTPVYGVESGTPGRLERGGAAVVKRRGPKGKRVSFYVGDPPKKISLPVGAIVKTKPRPFMRPAFDKEVASHMPSMFKDSMTQLRV